jgi:hypothetical protein
MESTDNQVLSRASLKVSLEPQDQRVRLESLAQQVQLEQQELLVRRAQLVQLVQQDLLEFKEMSATQEQLVPKGP